VNIWGERVIDDEKARYVLLPIVRRDSPLMMQKMWIEIVTREKILRT
jgi:hypothetical protein